MPHLTADELRCLHRPLPDWGIATPTGPLPLQAVTVAGTVTGLDAALTVTHTFRNDRTNPIEAVYTFPLPDRFAVAGMSALLGDREVTGRIDERTQAQEDYQEALDSGQRAALLEQERGDVFTAQLGNLPPGETARITLRLAGRLGVDAGEATFRFPLVVADRYVPGIPLAADPQGTGVRPDTDRVPDASRISPPRTVGPTGVEVSVDVEIRAGGLLTGEPRVSPTVTMAETPGGWRLGVTAAADLDRDLVARLGVRDEAGAAAFLSADADDPTQGTWQVIVTPPKRAEAAARRTVAFALDRSGSMAGWKMVAARRAAARIVDSLGDGDSFAVFAFDDVVETPPGPSGPIEATDHHRFEAVRWLGALEARGGTELADALTRAAQTLKDADGERVLVLLTDGQVGNEAELLRLMASELGGVRVYALGVDQAVNATFLRRLAAVGGGRCDLVESESELDQVLTHLHRRIAAPVARGIAVAIDGVRLDRDLTTPASADLFAAGPTVLQGRWRSTAPLDATALTVTAMAETDAGVTEWPATVTVVNDPVDTLRNSWARARLEMLQDAYDTGTERVGAEAITEFSLAHQVLCPFTAWVAVGPGGVTGPLETVVQPVANTYDQAVPMSMLSYAAPAAGSWSGAYGAPVSRAGVGRSALFAEESGAEEGLPPVDLAPFGDRLRELIERCLAGGDAALRREIAELVSDLESVDAPADLVAAIAALPDGVDEVRRRWAEHTGTDLG